MPVHKKLSTHKNSLYDLYKMKDKLKRVLSQTCSQERTLIIEGHLQSLLVMKYYPFIG